MKLKWLFLLLFPFILFSEEVSIQAKVELSSLAPLIDENLILKIEYSAPVGWTLNSDKLQKLMFFQSNLIADKFLIENVTLTENSAMFIINPLVLGKSSINLVTIPFKKGKEEKIFVGPLFNIDVQNVPFHPEATDALIEGLLPPRLEPLLEISDANLDKLKKETELTRRIIEEKAFPFKTVVLSLLLLVICMLIFSYFETIKWWILKTYFPPPSPEDVARKRLKTLEKVSVNDEMKWKENYAAVSDILRSYIEEKHQFPMTKLTTREFLQDNLANKIFLKDTKEHLAKFLEFSDLVKFAGQKPTTQDYKEAIEEAKSMINLKNQ